MSLSITVDFRDKGKLDKAMRRWRSLTEGELLNRIAQRLAKQTRRRIRTGKAAPDGAPWVPRKDDKPHGLLTDTLALVQSIRVTRKSRQEKTIGSPLAKAAFLHRGTSKMPARPFFGVSTENAKDLNDLISSWVARRFV